MNIFPQYEKYTESNIMQLLGYKHAYINFAPDHIKLTELYKIFVLEIKKLHCTNI